MLISSRITQVGPPVDTTLPPYSPTAAPLTSVTPGVIMTQGDKLNQLKRERTGHHKSASAGIVR